MHYALLIYERPANYEGLSDDERHGDDRRVHGRGRVRGRAPPTCSRSSMATTRARGRRRHARHRRPVRRDQGRLRRLLRDRGRRPRRGDRARRAGAGRARWAGASRSARCGGSCAERPRASGDASSRSWSASSATSTSPRRPCRRRSWWPPSAGRATASRRTRGAWLVTVRQAARDRPACGASGCWRPSSPLLSSEEPPMDGGHRTIADERLELIFTCCHPALAREAQVALTLRALGGLSTEEIAAAFLVAPETMKRRLSRAKAKIRGAGHPLRRAARRAAARAARRGARGRLPDLQRGLRRPRGRWPGEAIRLGRVLASLMPDEPEVHGLLALMLCHDARRVVALRGRRAGPAGRPGPRAVGRRADRGGPRGARARAGAAGPRPVRAAGRDRVAADSSRRSTGRRSSRSTPSWRALTRSPVVELNRAVAIAEAGSPRRRARDRRRACRSTTTATCTRPAPSCCAGSAGPRRRAPPTTARSPSAAPSPSAASSNAASPREPKPHLRGTVPFTFVLAPFARPCIWLCATANRLKRT